MSEDKKLLIVDTYLNNEYFYNNFSKLMENISYKAKHLNFYNLLNEKIEQYDIVFFLISNEFLNNQQNFIVKDVIKKIKYFSTISDKTLGLIFPEIITIQQLDKAKKILKIYTSLNSKTRRKLKPFINIFFKEHFSKNIFYDTTLCKKPDNIKIDYLDQFKCNYNDIVFLPYKIQDFIPFGLYIKNEEFKNHLFISKFSFMFFHEISEEFRINPINQNIRNKLFSYINKTMQQLKMLSSGQNIEDIEKIKILPVTIQHETKSRDIKGICCGWMEIDAYSDEFLQKAVENIINAKLNLLWFSFSPELYFSKNAIKSEKKEEYLNKIRKFTKKLKEECKRLSHPIPKIFLGIELTGNFKIKPIKNCMKDIYGNSYTKIPSPFDEEKFYIVHAGIGNINESDILLAESSKSIIYAFGVKTESKALLLAQKNSIAINTFYVIYHLIDELEELIKSKKEIQTKKVKIGEVVVRKVFDIKGVGIVPGFYVKSGRIEKGSHIVVFRGNKKIGEGLVKSLQREKKSVKEVAVGFEGALFVEGFNDWVVEDRIECFIDVPIP